MSRRLPNKDTVYDPAPYNALAQEHRDGGDVQQRVAELIVSTRTRPGFMAKRLNLADIPTPKGGRWDWITVSNAKDREKTQAIIRGWRTPPVRSPDDPTPLATLRNDLDDDNWLFEDDTFQTPWGPMSRDELSEGRELPNSVVGRRELWTWTGR